jgi:tetratricopeptide (TPR) repeat protein
MTEFKQIIGPGVPSGQYLPITIEKPGFDSETVAIPASRFGTLITDVNIKLKAGTKREHEQNTAKMIIDRLFLAQKYALTQQFERAQAELDRILEDFPTFARAMSMRASIYYAQKNFPESLKWYELALKADPQMEDAVKVSAKIRALQSGDRAPAASSGAGAVTPAITSSGTVTPPAAAAVEIPTAPAKARADAPSDKEGGK